MKQAKARRLSVDTGSPWSEQNTESVAMQHGRSYSREVSKDTLQTCQGDLSLLGKFLVRGDLI